MKKTVFLIVAMYQETFNAGVPSDLGYAVETMGVENHILAIRDQYNQLASGIHTSGD